MTRVAILSAVRTPIGKFLGGLAGVSAAELGTIAVTEALRRAGVEKQAVDEVIIGNARQAGNRPNLARQILYRSGIPKEVPGYTVNQACASGLKSIFLGHQTIVMGAADVVVAGGTESMSQVPFLLANVRSGHRLGHLTLTDGMYRDGFVCGLCDQVMGETAETLAEQYRISREEQDRYAMGSQHRAEQAMARGRFAAEIVAVELTERKEAVRITQDEHPRKGVTLEALARLKPVFRRQGSVTAGNASGITDGAAAVVLASEEKARALGCKPLAYIGSYVITGVDPKIMGIGPVPAVRKLFAQTGLTMGDIDLVELNEAFAVQVLAVDRKLRFDRDKLNVNGGAIALGHPIGATGTRIVVTLLHEMIRRDAAVGLATLCVSGGLGAALIITRE